VGALWRCVGLGSPARLGSLQKSSLGVLLCTGSRCPHTSSLSAVLADTRSSTSFNGAKVITVLIAVEIEGL